MFLDEYSSTQLQRDTKKVFDAANKQAIIVTRMGSDSVVMLSKKEYAKLMKKSQA